MASYIGVSPPEQTGIVERYQFTGDGSTTVFSGNDNNGKEFRYISTNTLLVFLNGVQLVEDTDFTKTSNSQITFAVAPTAADELELLTFGSFDLNSPSTLRTDLGLELANGKILLGNSSGVSTQVTPSGDATLSNAGVITLADTYRIPGKLAGTNFTGSLLIGHSTTGTLNAATYNTGVGLNVLDALTSGDSNTALGHNALSTNTIGGGNTAIGRDALLSNNNGGDLTAVGFQALRLNSGSNSTAVGKNALVSNSTGSKNTALGVTALGSVAVGDGNIGIGYTSGNNITSGSGNVVIGVADVASATGDKQFKISDGEDGSVVWLTGDSSGNIGIKQTSPTAGLHIGGNGTDNGSFKVVASTGSEWFKVEAGTVSINSQGGSTKVAGASTLGARMNIAQLSASTAALALAGGQANNILEINSANSDLGGDYLVVGQTGKVGIGTTSPSQPLHVVGNILGTGTIEASNFKQEGTNFTGSLLVGHSTTGTLNSAQYNTGVGVEALDALTSGDSNTAVGYRSATSLSTGINNTSIGETSLFSIQSGSHNTAMGHQSLYANVGGTNNTGVGRVSLGAVNSGNQNVGIGKSAGNNITTGSGNIIIGSVDADSATGDRQLKIAGNDFNTTTTWIKGDSAGLVTMSGGILTPTITGLTSLTTENINIDNNSITALNSSIEQFTHTGIVRNWFYPSEALDNSGFIKRGNTTVTANQIAAPDGTNTADKVEGVGRANSTYSDIYRSINGASQETLEHSFYIKRISTSGILTVMNPANSSHGLWELDLSALSNDWERIHKDHSAVTVTNIYKGLSSGGAFNSGFHISTLSSNTTGDYDFYIWGIQIDTSSTLGDYIPNASTVGGVVGIGGFTRGTSGTTATTVNSGTSINLGSFSTTTTAAISATATKVTLTTDSGSPSGPGTGTFGTSNIDLNLSSSGTGSVTINQIKTNSVTGEVIPGKLEGTNFTDSLLIGHSTTGTLSSADRNTGVGIEALDALTAGDTNTAVGYQSGTLITYGQQNTSLGGASLAANVSGGYNTSAGAYSLQKTTANNNTAFGYQAGKEVVGGASNIFLGYQAGNNITSGDGNVVIGNGDVASATGDKQLKISDGVDGSVVWLTGDSAGLVTMSGGISTPTITGLTSLTTENVNIDNNSITAVASNIEQVSYTSVTTNILLYSQTYSNSYWNKANSSITANATTAPDGTTTASKFNENTVNSQHRVLRSSLVTGVAASKTFTFSSHFKAAERSAVKMEIYADGQAVTSYALFGLSGDGTVGDTFAVDSTAITSVGNGWYRCSMTRTVNSSASGLRVYHITATGTSNGDDSYAGSTSNGIYLWGSQLEEGVITSYLPTTSASLSGITGVTRGVSGTTAATASSGTTITLGSISTTISANIDATQTTIPLTSDSGVAASGSASIGTSNMDLNLSASGTGSVTINEIKTNSVTGEVIPGKVQGTNFTGSLLVGHSNTGTLTSDAIRNTGVGISALNDLINKPENTALGYNAMGNAATASYSTGIGSQTLMNGGVYNVAVGRYALPFATDRRNTAVGTNSGSSVTVGHDNILLGYQAGNNITTGDGNVIIGTVNADSATGDRQLKIAGNDNTTTTTWLTGDSAGLVTMSGGISTPSIIGLTSLTTENVNIDNNSITALNSSIEQVSYTDISQNLFLYSEQINNSYWTKIGGTITADSTTAPDGTTTADKFISVTTSGSYFSVKPTTSTTGQPYTVSIYAKAGDTDSIRITNVSSGQTGAWFDLTNGTIGTQNDTVSSGNTSTITDVGNGWYKCTRTFPVTINDVTNYFLFGNNSGDNATTAPGSNKFIYVWGAQVSDGTNLTTYSTTTTGVFPPSLTGVTRGTNGTTAATASSGDTITLGSASTTLTASINATQTTIPLASLTGVAASGTASIGTSNMDLNLSASGTGSVTINQIKTNSVTGEVIPGKIGGTNFTDSLIIGHSTTGTLNSAERNTGVGVGAMLSLTSGDRNTVMGRNTGRLISSGSDNVLIGTATGQNVSTAEENTVVGTEALLSNSTSGTGNSGFGYQSLKTIGSGDYNIGLGWKSGDALTNGKGNVIIGSNADVPSATGDRQLVIAGYDGTTTTTWLTGDSSGNVTVAGDFNVTDALTFSGNGSASAPIISLGDTNTGIYRNNSGNYINFTHNGTNSWLFGVNNFQYQPIGGGPGLRGETASSTNPTLIPFRTDSDTGVGADGSNGLYLITGGATGLTVDSSGNVTVAGKIITGDTELQSGAKSIISAGTSNLEVTGSSNGMRLYTKNGGVEGFAAGSEGGLGHGAIALRGQTILVGGNSSKGFAFGRNVNWSDVNTLGQEDIKIKGDTVITTGDVTLANDKKVIFGDAGEYIVGDGTNLNIVSSNALGIDVPNGITLDSGSGGTTLRAGGGTTYGTLTSSSGDLSINQTTSNKDIIFTGNDGGSTIEAMRIDMSEGGRVGIGTANPGSALHMRIDGGGANLLLERSTAGVTSMWGIKPYNDKLHFRDESVNPIVDNFTMTSTGRFGIGTSSPSNTLEITGSGTPININSTNDEVKKIQFENSGVVQGYYGCSSGTPMRILNGSASELMRISSNGAVGINSTATTLPLGTARFIVQGAHTTEYFGVDQYGVGTYRKGGTGTQYAIEFRNDNGLVGRISVNGSATTYATSSDYRLKENVSYDFDATSRLKQLKPARFNFIADGTDKVVDGFIAHEVSSVVPEAISGTKDAVDADGNPDYQGIDQSKLVPLLVKTIQELEARIKALEDA